MDKKATAKRLRSEGYKYREIAEILGCSHQYVAQILGKQQVEKFRVIDDSCIYPNLRRWMNENQISRAELTRLMDYVPVAENQIRLAKIMRGEVLPKKDLIDTMISVTKLPYEVLFATNTAKR